MTATERPVMPEGTRRMLVWSAVASLLLVHFVLANAAAWNKSGTFDEASHIANGYSNIVTGGDYRMFPVAILPYRWMTLPLVIKGVPAPGTDSEIWHRVDNYGYGRQLLFEMGNDGMWILHATRMMTSIWSVLTAVIVFAWSRKLFGTAGGFISLALYVFNPTVMAHAAQATVDACATFFFTASIAAIWWAMQRLTPSRTLLSALLLGGALCAKFSAMLLIPIAFILVVYRTVVDRPLEIRFFGRSAEIAGKLRRIPFFAGFTLAHVAGVMLVVWTMFGFRFHTFGTTPIHPDWATSFERSTGILGKRTIEERQNGRDQPGVQGAIIRFARTYHLLPEPYLYNFSEQLGSTRFRSAYLDGWFGIAGFPSFFPLCFWYKTPIPTLLVLMLALIGHGIHRRNQITIERRAARELFRIGFYATIPLWCLLAIYWFTSITGGINIGIRHILPTFPPLFILAGAAADWFRKEYDVPAESKNIRSARLVKNRPEPANVSKVVETVGREPWRQAMNWCLAGMLLLLAVNVVYVSPNYLSYFNLFAGGSDNGYRHLVDSSLDWGQDLPSLKSWLDEEILVGDNPPRTYLSYFGTTPPSYHGIKPTLLPCYASRETLEPAVSQEPEPTLSEGIYCISATMLQNVYNAGFPGPWQKSYEQTFLELTNFYYSWLNMSPEQRLEEARKRGEIELNKIPTNMRDQTIAQMNEQLRQSPNPRHQQLGLARVLGEQEIIKYISLFEWARLGRLCAYLRNQKPYHIINNSIFVYKLSEFDITQACPFPPPGSSTWQPTPAPELIPNPKDARDPIPYSK